MIIELYTSDTCGNCLRAKRYLDQTGIEYFERNISDEAIMNEMITRTGGLRSVPQIFVNNKHIGGYDELLKVV